MGLLSSITKPIKSIGSSVGGLLNRVTGVTDTAKQSMNDQIKLWNMQNAYNMPSAQIARMADAGIDINPMTYAVGNGSMDTKASSIGSPHYSGSGINPIASAMSVVNGIADFGRTKAETANLEQQNSNLTVQHEATVIDNMIKAHNLAIARKLKMPVGQTPILYGQAQGLGSVGKDIVDIGTKLGESSIFNRVVNPFLKPFDFFHQKFRDFRYKQGLKK